MISVIIPVYRDVEVLARTLALTELGDAHVIVVYTRDDAESLATLRAAHPRLAWIDAPRGRPRR